MDGQYDDPRLVALYDALNPPGPAEDAFVGLVGDAPRSVLDLGCGTGQLALRLAALGHAVTGADPSPAMLAVARAKDTPPRVEWIEADARTLALARTFDVVVMTGNAFQVLLADTDIAAVLATFRRHVASGGRVAFDTRDPADRAWERWARARRTAGEVAVTYEILDVRGDLVRFATHHAFADRTVTSDSTLRFLDPGDLATRVRAAGFATVELRPGIIVVAS